MINGWRDELDTEQQILLKRAESTIEDWHEGSIDCWQWQVLVVRMAGLLDEHQISLESDDTLGDDQ